MYEFGEFRLDVQRRILTRGDSAIALTSKGFDALLLLIEHRDRVLSKDELMERLWSRVVVEEANLTQTIFMVRKALGETARDHRYIVTVPGVGYRFGQPVVEISPEQPAPNAAQPCASAAPAPLSIPKRWAIAAALIACLTAVGAYIWLGASRSPPQARAIVVAEFDNHTGEDVFDRTLRRAAMLQLSQSPFFRIVSDQRTAATLALMRKPAGTTPKRETASEVCVRNGADAVLNGALERVGERYFLTLEASACESSELLASATADAADSAQVLDALGGAASALRSQLGESLESVKRYDRPVRAATTTSLEAYALFSAAADRFRFGPDPSAAIPLFEQAIQLDPEFALAYSYLGNLLLSLGETERGKQAVLQAYEFRDRVSERERLLILSDYHSSVTGDLNAELATYELWRAQYPHDWLPANYLAGVYCDVFGDFERCMQFAKESMQLDAQQPYGAELLATALSAVGRPDEAQRVLKAMLVNKMDGGRLRAGLHAIALMQQDEKLAAEQVRWSAAQPVQDDIGWMLAYAAAQFGEVNKASALMNAHAAALEQAGFQEAAAYNRLGLALRFASYEDQEAARALAAAAHSGPIAGANASRLALVYALINDRAEAERFIAEASDADRSLIARVDVQLAQALLALHAKQPKAALERLAPLQRFDGVRFAFMRRYVRGLALLELQDAAGAGAEFKFIIDRRGYQPTSQLWPLAHVGYARALAAGGDASGARAAYRRALELLRNADADLQFVRRLREEAERLERTT